MNNTLAICSLIFLFLLAGCGDSSDISSDDDQDYSIAWLTINASPVNADKGDTTHVSLHGKAFVSPDYVKHHCGGIACLLASYDNSDPGVNVTWRNQTTGEFGSASSRYGSATSFRHLWSAYISIAPGDNHLVITASDPGRNTASESIIIEPGTDIMPPSVTATIPADGEGNINLSDPVTARFSESIDPTTVNENSFTINSYWGDPVRGPVSVSESGTRVTLAPRLGINTNYTATLTTDITDISGKPLSEDYAWTFSTGKGDFEAPTVMSTEPADRSVDVSLFKSISASFSEKMDHSTITSSTFTLLDATASNVDGSVSISSSGSIDVAGVGAGSTCT